MKIILIIIAILIGLFIAFQIYTAMATSKTETQAYDVILVADEYEIRYYPSVSMAMVTSHLKTFRDLGSSGFGTLAKYIFGGNSENKQIAMTSPVHMEIGDSVSTMAFVMPAEYKKEELPNPNNANIALHTSEPEYVAVRQFSGFASTETINEQRAILEKALQKKGLTYHGNFRFLGYNPPYQLLGRRNEVIVALNAREIDRSNY
jgi:hypothetical protein